MTRLLALAVLLLAVTASSGAAATPAHAPILGVVPHTSRLAAAPHAMLLSRTARATSPTKLTFDPNYENLINQYFTDVAHDSGGAHNVYGVATQYSDNSGPVQYQSTFGGSYVDKNPLPKNGCNDKVDTYCLTDAQIEKQIQSVMTAKGWQGGLNNIFFLMTPRGVGSCFDGVTHQCSTNAFCAYHSAFTNSSKEPTLYANIPYEGPSGGCADQSQGFPNGDPDADTAINLISHEHNETITDPLNNGWLSNDVNQDEEADLCAYVFGAPLGGTPGIDAYNQVINGHHYDLQEEFSNRDSGCVQQLGGTPSPAPSIDGTGPLVYRGGSVMHTNTVYAIYWLPTALPAVTKAPHILGRTRVGKKLSGSPGSWTSSPTRYRYQWLRCNAHGGSCSSIHGATHSTYKLTRLDAGHRLRLRVTATNAAGSNVAKSAASARVQS